MNLPGGLTQRPGKIVCVGLNYRSHLHGRPEPRHPELFFKPSTALVASGEAIRLPPDARRVEAEGELAVIIGKTARNLTVAEAMGIVRGFACALDISEREWQGADKQWWRAKGCDTFCPVGPVAPNRLDPGAELVTRINGREAQRGAISDLIFGVAEVIAFGSRYLTWEEGDILLTGTPGEPPRLVPGDVVEVEITGLASVRCPCEG